MSSSLRGLLALTKFAVAEILGGEGGAGAHFHGEEGALFEIQQPITLQAFVYSIPT